MNLLQYQNNVYSQNGEDGIIAQALSMLPVTNGWCVEFGAWDGKYLSNTRNLIAHRGYKAVLIEADMKLFKRLQLNTGGFEGVTVLNRFVGFSEHDSLDTLLAETACPQDFDFLSIDVDGNDIHIWRAIKSYRPKLVCIEFNPTIPTEVVFAQPADPKIKWGSSLAAVTQLADDKRYELICANDLNAFFVTAELFPLFGLKDNSPAALRSKDCRTFVFAGYDGTLLLSGNVPIPWHGFSVSADEMQPIPGLLRKYPPDYNSMQRFAAGGFRLLRRIRKRLNTKFRKRLNTKYRNRPHRT